MTERPGHSTAEALEASVEGVPAAVSLTPSSVVPALGGELVLAPEGPDGALGVDQEPLVSTDSVRAGLRQAGPLAIAGLVANGAAVVVTVIMARLLSTRGYGALAQLTGLFLIVSMPGSAIIVGVVRHVTAWKGEGSARRIWRWARRLHFQATIALVVFLVAVVLARGLVADALSLPDAVGVVGVLGAGALWVLLSLDRGLLQAHRNYRSLSLNLLVEGGARTVAMLALVGLGLGVAGAAWGLFLGELVTAIHARIVADRAWSSEARREEAAVAASRPDGTVRSRTRGASHRSARSWWEALIRRDPVPTGSEGHRRQLLVDLLTALAAMALLALLQNIDVIVLGREDPHASGGYAAVSVASKALVFGAIALGGYLLPEATIRWRQGGHALRQLVVTLSLLAVPAAALLCVAVAFPHLLLSIVFSNRYLGSQHAFVWLALAMVCLSMTVVLTIYLLAIGRRWIAAILAVGAVATTTAVAMAHGSPTSTAVSDLVVQALLAAVTIAFFMGAHKQRRQLAT